MSGKLETVGERIVRLRKAIQMSRAELAQHCDVSVTTVGLWEKNRMKLSADSIFLAAKCLGVTAHELWSGRPEYPEDATPEFQRLKIKSQEQLWAQAKEWLMNLTHALSELEPRHHANTQSSHPPRKKRPGSKDKTR